MFILGNRMIYCSKVGKMLCALYVKENCVGLMIIFGKAERIKFDASRENYSNDVQKIHDEAKTYHDEK